HRTIILHPTCGDMALLEQLATQLAVRCNAAALALLQQKHDLRHYLRSHYGDHTFEHLYRWNWFDTSLLIPYFVVMVILAFYGLPRYQLVYLYYKHRKNAAREPLRRFEQLPRVTIQLPIFNEQFVIDRLIESCTRIDYPRELLDIQVLDDSTDETREVAASICDRYRALGYPIYYLHRTN